MISDPIILCLAAPMGNSHQFWDYSSLDALGDVNRKHYVAMDSVSYAADLIEPLLTFGSIKNMLN